MQWERNDDTFTAASLMNGIFAMHRWALDLTAVIGLSIWGLTNQAFTDLTCSSADSFYRWNCSLAHSRPLETHSTPGHRPSNHFRETQTVYTEDDTLQGRRGHPCLVTLSGERRLLTEGSHDAPLEKPFFVPSSQILRGL